jgi:hypothetical protein
VYYKPLFISFHRTLLSIDIALLVKKKARQIE